MEISREVSQKTKNITTIQFNHTTPGHMPKESKSAYSKGTCTPMFIAARSTIAKLWNQQRCPSTDEWIKKMWHIYTTLFPC
jgi:hypothetical protein